MAQVNLEIVSKQEAFPFHRTRQWCPQCWQTATLLVTISSRRGGGRFPFRSASCDQITGRNSSLNGHIHQPISSHHAKLWRVARRSRTSSTRTSRLRQRGHFMQSTPFLLWICTHYTACTPLLQSLFRHFRRRIRQRHRGNRRPLSLRERCAKIRLKPRIQRALFIFRSPSAVFASIIAQNS